MYRARAAALLEDCSHVRCIAPCLASLAAGSLGENNGQRNNKVAPRVGRRTGENCRAFLADLRARLLGAPEISSDAFSAYPDAVERAFGVECSFGTIEKHYAVD